MFDKQTTSLTFLFDLERTGSNNAARIEITAMTTSNSISVKPFEECFASLRRFLILGSRISAFRTKYEQRPVRLARIMCGCSASYYHVEEPQSIVSAGPFSAWALRRVAGWSSRVGDAAPCQLCLQRNRIQLSAWKRTGLGRHDSAS